MKGFTLLEVLLVLAIVGIISAVSFLSLSNVNKEKALTAEAEKVLSLLTKARSLSLAAKDGAAYGVHFEERTAVLFKGSSYSAGASGNEGELLNDAVKISAIALTGGGSEVMFKKLTGATAQNGTITIAALQNASQTKVITIAATGIAYSN